MFLFACAVIEFQRLEKLTRFVQYWVHTCIPYNEHRMTHGLPLIFQWRQLADSDKQVYEEKARRINEENTRKWAEEQKAEDDRWE